MLCLPVDWQRRGRQCVCRSLLALLTDFSDMLSAYGESFGSLLSKASAMIFGTKLETTGDI